MKEEPLIIVAKRHRYPKMIVRRCQTETYLDRQRHRWCRRRRRRHRRRRRRRLDRRCRGSN